MTHAHHPRFDPLLADFDVLVDFDDDDLEDLEADDGFRPTVFTFCGDTVAFVVVVVAAVGSVDLIFFSSFFLGH